MEMAIEAYYLLRWLRGWLLKSDETYPMFRCGLGGAGGGNTEVGSQGDFRVEHDMRKAFRCEIIRISLAESG